MSVKTKEQKRGKKRLVVATTALVLVGGGAAYAWWSAGGSGTGDGKTGTTSTLTVNQTSAITGLAPGVAAQTLSGTFDNPNTGPVHVTSVTASISSVTDSIGGAIVGCDATDYTLGNATMTVNAEVAAGTSKGAWTGATIAFNNKASNQDACKGAVVHFAYSVS